MNNRDIEWRKEKLEQKRLELEAGQMNAMRELIPRGVVEEICQRCGYDFRIRLLTPIVTIFQMIQSRLKPGWKFSKCVAIKWAGRTIWKFGFNCTNG